MTEQIMREKENEETRQGRDDLQIMNNEYNGRYIQRYIYIHNDYPGVTSHLYLVSQRLQARAVHARTSQQITRTKVTRNECTTTNKTHH